VDNRPVMNLNDVEDLVKEMAKDDASHASVDSLAVVKAETMEELS
jgi:hypothetical protein